MRIVGENVENGIYPLKEALRIAEGMDLDLVEISDKAEMPVCRIVEFSKFLYDKKRRDKELKAKTVKSVLKEIRFGPNTDDHDVEFKATHARKFLEDGFKVKVYVHFKGRTIIHSDRGRDLLMDFVQMLEDIGKLESPPKLEGKRMIIFINPKTAAKK